MLQRGLLRFDILIVQAAYHFHCDNEGTAWRVIGLAVRTCVELGLHRREVYELMTEEERDSTVCLFWSIYILDKRWSFGTGMPFALQDADLDPSLPRPVSSDMLDTKFWTVKD